MNTTLELTHFQKDILDGLQSNPKYLLSKYFYDGYGDALYEQIVNLPEYYLYRCEKEILQQQAGTIIKNLPITNTVDVIELGVGNGQKSKLFLFALEKNNIDYNYIPIDISHSALTELKKNILTDLPNCTINPLQGDYFEMLSVFDSNKPKIIKFMGSNLGNMFIEDAVDFLFQIQEKMSPQDTLLLGIDKDKDSSVILPAYNDAQGVTARFNLNLLSRINAECSADITISNFAHAPIFNETVRRAESYLESMCDQTIHLFDNLIPIHFEKGEKIFMEISQKYSVSTMSSCAYHAGLHTEHVYTDSQDLYMILALTKR